LGQIKKQQFDSELILAWTNKKIIFQGVHLPEALRILENWYGVQFEIETRPTQEITLYGVFQDETLENILENLSYTANFNYKINNDEVKLKFN
jgi:ferric-dicitrate binding protein FerR (iron transport regulator)